MDPISTIVGIGRITSALYDQAQYIYHNKEQCLRLLERIKVINSTLVSLKVEFDEGKPIPESYRLAILDLHGSVQRAESLFEKLTKKDLFKQFQVTFFAQTTNYEILEIHQQLDQGLLQLNLGLQIQSVLDKQEKQKLKKIEREKFEKETNTPLMNLKIAQKTDLEELLSKSEPSEKQKLLNMPQLHEIKEKKLASLQYNIDEYILMQGKLKNNQKIESRKSELFSVPFSDLIIENLISETRLGKLYYGTLYESPVAIRVLEGNLDPKDIERFNKEVSAMDKARGEYVLPIFAICQEPGRLCLVTKYMQQGSLRQVLNKVDKQEAKLSIEQRHQLILEIACGLNSLHGRQICHRNLNSEHVLIDEKGQAYIAEFRLSQNKMLSSLYEERESVLEWMAPEIWMNSQSFTPQADIYSFGMVVWEMMTCEIPYASWDRTTWIDRIQKGERENLPSTVPQFYCDIIKSCWQARPEDRPSLLSIITDLKAYKIKNEATHILTGSSSSFWKSEKSVEEATTPSIESGLLPLISQADAKYFHKAAKVCCDNFTLAAVLSYRRHTLINNERDVPQPSEKDAEHFAKAGEICFNKQQFDAAEVCYRQAVILGNSKGMNGLAILHLTQGKAPESKGFAYQMLTLAANLGYQPAIINLAKQLEQGDGIKANPSEASKWREKVKRNETPSFTRRCTTK